MSGENRRGPRVAIGLGVRIAYGSASPTIDRHTVNVSRGGIFVRSREPQPPGTPVHLDISLLGGSKVIRGTGVVVWSTAPSAPGEPPHEPGMGIRFEALDPASRAAVDEIVSLQGSADAPGEPPQPYEGPPPADEGAQVEVQPVASGTRAARRPRPRPSKIIGIDLGTTNSCVAIAENGKVRVLESKEGYRTTPSVVAYDAEGRRLVGHAAKGQMVVNPRNTVYGSKRLVGRPFNSPTVQACRDRFHYDIIEGAGGSTAVRFAGRDFSLEQVAALVLGEIREVASQAVGEPISRAVVTVPAYYNDHQRNAVREAGRLAGLQIERIVNEPTAAAIAFGFGKTLQRRVLVYDLGGGTFDASVLEIEGDVYEVVSTGGDTFLGGVDFDAQLVDHLVWKFTERHGFPPATDRAGWQRIRDAAEELKVALSERESAAARVPFICQAPDGQQLDLDVTVTRAELEQLTGSLVERTIDVCREVLAARGIASAELDDVLLVGGQSRMPLVSRRIREVFGKDPTKGIHPDEAVAIGAAVLAESETRIDSVVLIDVLAIGIGVGLPGGRMAQVLPRNTRLPARKTYEIATVKDDQPELDLAVFQGDSQKASECEYLGTLRLTGLAPGPKGSVRFSVEFALGPEGILSVSATNVATQERTVVQLATLDTPESLREKLQLGEAPTPPKGSRPYDVAHETGADGTSRTPAPTAAVPERGPAAEEAKRPGFLGRFFGKRS
ncbi:MAG TPA: TIGR02266 family protein [Anaeromyxobacteraceae bacterium]|nr:TIGR02266 family protein [Anaeromyxobacteraceae bacterium]